VDLKEVEVALAVALEGDLGGVVATAVGLDDEALLGPEEVDLEDALRGADRRVDGRHRQPRLRDERQELGLEEAPHRRVPRRLRDRPPLLDHPPEARSAPPFRPAVEHRLDRSEVEIPVRGRPLEGLPQPVLPVDAGKVHHRPRHVRAGDPVDPNQFAPRRECHPMRFDPVDLSPSLFGRDEVDDDRRYLADLKNCRCASMRNHPTWASERRRPSASARPEVPCPSA
jgi:hypothetical protein